MKKQRLSQANKAIAGGVKHEESIPNHYHIPNSPDKDESTDELMRQTQRPWSVTSHQGDFFANSPSTEFMDENSYTPLHFKQNQDLMGQALSERIKIDENISVPSSLQSAINIGQFQLSESSSSEQSPEFSPEQLEQLDVSRVSSYNSNFEYLETKPEEQEVKLEAKSCLQYIKSKQADYNACKTSIGILNGVGKPTGPWPRYFAQNLTRRDKDKPSNKKFAFNKYKWIMTLIKVICIPIIIQSFIGILKLMGTPKQQKVVYKTFQNLTYDLAEVPNLLPMHFFILISETDVHNRIGCNNLFNQRKCQEIEMLKCYSKGVTSLEFEQCVIALADSIAPPPGRLLQDSDSEQDEDRLQIPNNSTQFCIDHYNNTELWTDELSPLFLLFYIRKHDCLLMAGVPYGREYCDDYKNNDASWNQAVLYTCYFEKKVIEASEYCDNVFASEDPATVALFFQCYNQYSLPKSEKYCAMSFPGQKNLDLRIKCFDELPVRNRRVCEDKYRSPNYFNFNNKTFQECLLDANYTLDIEFCSSVYIFDFQIDDLYDCYASIGLVVPKDRAYCEIKYKTKKQQKYECLAENELEQGAEFCLFQYPFSFQYQQLFDCLGEYGVEKHTDYCDLKVESEGGDDKSLWDCYEKDFNIENTELDCGVIRVYPFGNAFQQATLFVSEIEVSDDADTGSSKIFEYKYQDLPQKDLNSTSNETNGEDTPSEVSIQKEMTFMNSQKFIFMGRTFQVQVFEKYETADQPTEQENTCFCCEFMEEDNAQEPSSVFNVWYLEPKWGTFMKNYLDSENLDVDIEFSDTYGIFLYWFSGILNRTEINNIYYDIFDQKALLEDPNYVIPLRSPEVDPNVKFDVTRDLFESVVNQLATALPENFLIDMTSMISTSPSKPKPTGYLLNVFNIFENTENYQEMTVGQLLEKNKEEPQIKQITGAFSAVQNGGLIEFLVEKDYTKKFYCQIFDVVNSSSEAFSEVLKIYEGEDKQPMIANIINEFKELVLSEETIKIGDAVSQLIKMPFTAQLIQQIKGVMELKFSTFQQILGGNSAPPPAEYQSVSLSYGVMSEEEQDEDSLISQMSEFLQIDASLISVQSLSFEVVSRRLLQEDISDSEQIQDDSDEQTNSDGQDSEQSEGTSDADLNEQPQLRIYSAVFEIQIDPDDDSGASQGELVANTMNQIIETFKVKPNEALNVGLQPQSGDVFSDDEQLSIVADGALQPFAENYQNVTSIQPPQPDPVFWSIAQGADVIEKTSQAKSEANAQVAIKAKFCSFLGRYCECNGFMVFGSINMTKYEELEIYKIDNDKEFKASQVTGLNICERTVPSANLSTSACFCWEQGLAILTEDQEAQLEAQALQELINQQFLETLQLQSYQDEFVMYSQFRGKVYFGYRDNAKFFENEEIVLDLLAPYSVSSVNAFTCNAKTFGEVVDEANSKYCFSEKNSTLEIFEDNPIVISLRGKVDNYPMAKITLTDFFELKPKGQQSFEFLSIANDLRRDIAQDCDTVVRNLTQLDLLDRLIANSSNLKILIQEIEAVLDDNRDEIIDVFQEETLQDLVYLIFPDQFPIIREMALKLRVSIFDDEDFINLDTIYDMIDYLIEAQAVERTFAELNVWKYGEAPQYRPCLPDCPDYYVSYFSLEVDDFVCELGACDDELSFLQPDLSCLPCPPYTRQKSDDPTTCEPNTCQSEFEYVKIDGTCGNCPNLQRSDPEDPTICICFDYLRKSDDDPDICIWYDDCEDPDLGLYPDGSCQVCKGFNVPNPANRTICTDCPDQQYPDPEDPTSCLCFDYKRKSDDDPDICVWYDDCEDPNLGLYPDGSCQVCPYYNRAILGYHTICSNCPAEQWPDPEDEYNCNCFDYKRKSDDDPKICVWHDECEDPELGLYPDGSCQVCGDYNLPNPANRTICNHRDCGFNFITAPDAQCVQCDVYSYPAENGRDCIQAQCNDYFYIAIHGRDCLQDYCSPGYFQDLSGRCTHQHNRFQEGIIYKSLAQNLNDTFYSKALPLYVTQSFLSTRLGFYDPNNPMPGDFYFGLIVSDLERIVDETCEEEDPIKIIDNLISNSMDIQQLIMDIDNILKIPQIANISIDLLYDMKDLGIFDDQKLQFIEVWNKSVNDLAFQVPYLRFQEYRALFDQIGIPMSSFKGMSIDTLLQVMDQNQLTETILKEVLSVGQTNQIFQFQCNKVLDFYPVKFFEYTYYSSDDCLNTAEYLRKDCQRASQQSSRRLQETDESRASQSESNLDNQNQTSQQNQNETNLDNQNQTSQEQQNETNQDNQNTQNTNNNLTKTTLPFSFGTWRMEYKDQIIGELQNGDLIKAKIINETSMNFEMTKKKGKTQEYFFSFDPDLKKQNDLSLLYNKLSSTDTLQNLLRQTPLNCYFSGWSDKPWIKIYLNETGTYVRKVKAFNFKNGYYTSLLEGVTFSVGNDDGDEKICQISGDTLPMNEFVSFECKDPDAAGRNPFEASDIEFEGIKAQYIKFQSNREGTLALCDIQIEGSFQDLEFDIRLAAQKEECQRLTDNCDVFSGETKYGCLKRYGVDRDSKYCSEISKSTHESFFYKNNNKYACLTSSENKFTDEPDIPNEFLTCLQKFHEYYVELCLRDIVPTEDASSYGNETSAVRLQQKSKAINLQSKDQVEIDLKLVEVFMCSYIQMQFITNPYYDIELVKQGINQPREIELGMDCNAFVTFDDVTKEKQYAIHYQFNEDVEIKSRLLEEDSPIFDSFFINKTDTNLQYFRLLYENDLDIMNVSTIFMYKANAEEIKQVKDNEEFSKLRFAQSTVKIFQSEDFQIGKSNIMSPLVFPTDTQLNKYIKTVDEEGYYFLGFPFSWHDVKVDTFFIKAIYTKVPTKKGDPDDNMFENIFAFKFNFNQNQFSITYFNLPGVGSKFGGVTIVIKQAFAQIGPYIVIAFFVWFTFRVKMYHQELLDDAKIDLLKKNLMLYKARIEAKFPKTIDVREDYKMINQLIVKFYPELQQAENQAEEAKIKEEQKQDAKPEEKPEDGKQEEEKKEEGKQEEEKKQEEEQSAFQLVIDIIKGEIKALKDEIFPAAEVQEKGDDQAEITKDLEYIEEKYPESNLESRVHLETLPLSISYYTAKTKSNFMQKTEDIKDKLSYYQTFQATKDIQFTQMLTDNTREVISECLAELMIKVPKVYKAVKRDKRLVAKRKYELDKEKGNGPDLTYFDQINKEIADLTNEHSPVRSPRSVASLYSKTSFYSAKFVYQPIYSETSSDSDPFELAYFVNEGINKPYLPEGDEFGQRYDFTIYNRSRKKLLGTQKSRTQEKLLSRFAKIKKQK